MLPRTAALVERHAKRPFALIGINSDSPEDPELRGLPFEKRLEPTRRHVKQAILDAHGLTWRNAIQCSTDGPLPTQWNVSSWPTLYVLDASGRIRYKGHDDEAMEKVVDACLAELQVERPAADKQ